ncbi:MAG TPA: RsfA family transcriptional regulator [Bacilli bacterium]
MATIRQDAWTSDDDLILAEVTLRHIREGSTQLKAFEEVGERIGRTAAACGFRWNSCVRKKYDPAIQIAKSQRQKLGRQKKKSGDLQQSAMISASADSSGARTELVSEETLSIDAVIRFLRQFRASHQEYTKQIRQLEKELKEKDEELQRLRTENENLSKQVNEVSSDYRVVNDDYKALIKIMDRARKLAFLTEEEDEHKPRFKMDANGNLERIE